MPEYHNWPNLKLTFLTNLGYTDRWGLPAKDLYEVRVVCKKTEQALNIQVKLATESLRERFPNAVDISLININWLEKPVRRPSFGGGPEDPQSEFPF